MAMEGGLHLSTTTTTENYSDAFGVPIIPVPPPRLSAAGLVSPSISTHASSVYPGFCPGPGPQAGTLS